MTTQYKQAHTIPNILKLKLICFAPVNLAFYTDKNKERFQHGVKDIVW